MGEVPEHACRECDGSGLEKKTTTLSVSIPPGMEDGSVVRLRGKGHGAPRGGTAGDLYLRVFVRPDPRFERDGYDIRSRVKIDFSAAALGTSLDVELVDGSVSVKIPEGIQSGTELRLRGKGIESESGRGDHLLTVIVETPTRLSKTQRKALEELGK